MSDGELRFLSARDLARRYQVHEITVWKWARDGVLPRPIKFTPGTTRWRSTDLEAHEASCSQREAKQIKPLHKTSKRSGRTR